MQDRPTATELAIALAMYLKEDLLPVVPKEHQFSVRVAAGAAATLAREAADPAPLASLAPLAELLGWSPPVDREEARALQAELAARIRAGELDDRVAELLPALLGHVEAKLAVWNPGYTS